MAASRGGETFDEAVQQGPGLPVDPVKVLENHQERLDLDLALAVFRPGVRCAGMMAQKGERMPVRSLLGTCAAWLSVALMAVGYLGFILLAVLQAAGV
jgi:hypothetical protein